MGATIASRNRRRPIGARVQPGVPDGGDYTAAADAVALCLIRLPIALVSGIDVATFDARINWPMVLSGSAARGIARRLSAMGGRAVAEPGSLIVEGSEGPLAPGELERAAAWAEELAIVADPT